MEKNWSYFLLIETLASGIVYPLAWTVIAYENMPEFVETPDPGSSFWKMSASFFSGQAFPDSFFDEPVTTLGNQ